MVLNFFSLVTYIQNISVIFESMKICNKEKRFWNQEESHTSFIFKSQCISLMNLSK